MRKFLKKGVVTAAVLTLMATPGFAAENNKVIETESVKVTVNRMEQELHETNVTAVVITEEEIRRNPAPTLAEQLAKIPGVFVENGGMAGMPRVSIRGEGTSRVLLMVDGIKISDQKSMNGPAYLIDPSDVERIEVIKGPASVLYGSEAIGGVINVITKKGGNKPIGGSLQMTFNSATDSWEPYGSIAGRYEGFNYRFSGNYIDAGDRDTPAGKVKYSRYRHTNLNNQVGYDWSHGSVFVGYDYFEGVISVPNTTTGGRSMVLDPWERETFKGGFEFNNFSEYLLKVKVNGFYQKTLKEQIMSYYIKNDMDSYGGSLQTDWLLFDDHYVIFGVDYYYDDLDTITINPLNVATIDDGQQTNLGIFVQDEWSVFEQLKIIAGARYTWVKTEANTANNGKMDSTDDNLVGSLGLVYMPMDGLALRANLSQGYKSPNLQQMYIGNFAGVLLPNEDLKPEKSTNYEIGARYNVNNWNIDTAIYYSDAKDFITSRSLGGGLSEYINVDSAQTVGFELGINYTFQDLGLTPYVVFNWMRRETKNSGYKSTDTGYPPFSGQVGVKWNRDLFENHTFFADLNYFYNSSADQKTSATATKTEYDSWSTLNLNMGFESHHQDCVNYFGSLSLNNLFDKEYLPARGGMVAPGFHAVATFGVTF